MGCSPDGQIAVSESGPAHFLKQIEDDLPFTECVQKGAERPQIQAIGAHSDEVTGHSPEFTDQHPQHHCFFGNLHPDQFLDSQRHAEVHVHSGQIIHPIRVRNPLDRAEILANLFSTSMQVPDVRSDLVDNFTISSQQQSQHAMCAGMLRSHIDEHFVCANVEFNNPGIFNSDAHDSSHWPGGSGSDDQTLWHSFDSVGFDSVGRISGLTADGFQASDLLSRSHYRSIDRVFRGTHSETRNPSGADDRSSLPHTGFVSDWDDR